MTGQYSYVDPLGSLVIVKYTADENGYLETREVRTNFLTIKAKPKKPAPPPRRVAPKADSNLVAKIIARLTPFIKETVNNSLTTRQAAQPLPVVSQATSKSSIFGDNGTNRITVDTPNYNFDKFLS